MQIADWKRDRERAGTLAAVARRLYEAGTVQEAMEARLRQCFVLEALVENDGDQTRTAESLGVSREMVKRVVRSLELNCREVRALAKEIGGDR